MPRLLNAGDILPLVASLTPQERVRLLRLIASEQESDSSFIRQCHADEFQVDDDLLSWDAEGVAPATRTIRGLDTEVVLIEDEGMPAECALSHVGIFRNAVLRHFGNSIRTKKYPVSSQA
jgi:hypothetical protein